MEGQKITSAYILAGGKSSRIGSDKGLILLNNLPMIQHISNVLSGIFTRVSIISGNWEYNRFNLPVYPDIIPDKGPLGGIYSALHQSDEENIFIISCDMPFISEHLIQFILANHNQSDIIVSRIGDRIHPLCGIYSQSILPELKKRIHHANLKVTDMFSSLDVTILDANHFGEDVFYNVNTLSDLEKVTKKK